MRYIVDIHSHMLPCVDDGAADFEETKKMIRCSYEEGCRHLFLTPHADSYNYWGKGIKKKIYSIKEFIEDEEMDLKIYLGAEIRFDSKDGESIERIIKKIKRGRYPTLNGTDYVMIEFFYGAARDYMSSVADAIIDAGYTPIVAHAERYNSSLDTLKHLKRMGTLLQMNLCDCRNAFTDMALEAKIFDFIGTDAHGIERRTPIIGEYVEYLYDNFDNDYVDKIVWDNPYNLLKLNNTDNK